MFAFVKSLRSISYLLTLHAQSGWSELVGTTLRAATLNFWRSTPCSQKHPLLFSYIEQETKLSLTGRAHHHITVISVEYDSRNNCWHTTFDRCNRLRTLYDVVFGDKDNESAYIRLKQQKKKHGISYEHIDFTAMSCSAEVISHF